MSEHKMKITDNTNNKFPLNVVIIEKVGTTCKPLAIKEFKEEELYKKCGFKSENNFKCAVEWKTKVKGEKYKVYVYGKEEGKANTENKYDFPPPIDNTLFYGNCVVVCKKEVEGEYEYFNLDVALWEKIYEKLFGGFEDLVTTSKEDEEEEDELENIPKEKKTKHGYLKDGFVVDSSDDSEDHLSNSDININDELDEDEEDDEDDDEEEEDDEDDDEDDEEDTTTKNLELDFEEYD
jgi:hypothetical protein